MHHCMSMNTCTNTCTHRKSTLAHMYTCTHACLHARTHATMHARTHATMHARTHATMHAHTHAHTCPVRIAAMEWLRRPVRWFFSGRQPHHVLGPHILQTAGWYTCCQFLAAHAARIACGEIVARYVVILFR